MDEVIFPLIVGVSALALLLFVLWTFIRFTVLSEWRTEDWMTRLRFPRIEEIEEAWRVPLPRALQEFYENGDLVRCYDVILVAPGAQGPSWYVLHFIPLRKKDMVEWAAVTRVPGIPLAIDDSKGAYYLSIEELCRSGQLPVLYRKPGLAKQDLVVAYDIEEFAQFRALEQG